MTTNNGGSSTGEPEPLDHGQLETMLCQFNIMETTGTTSITLLLSDHTEEEEICFKRLDGSMDQSETSEIWDKDASMLLEILIQTEDTANGTNATTVETKDGPLTEKDGTTQDIQSKTVSDSKLDQE